MINSVQLFSQTHIQLYEDTAKTRYEILKVIPIGSDAGKARTIMLKNNFSCQWMKHSDFSTGSKIISNINFLYCDLEKSKGLLVSSRWQVALIHEKGKITRVLVSYGLTGP